MPLPISEISSLVFERFIIAFWIVGLLNVVALFYIGWQLRRR